MRSIINETHLLVIKMVRNKVVINKVKKTNTMGFSSLKQNIQKSSIRPPVWRNNQKHCMYDLSAIAQDFIIPRRLILFF